MHLVSYLINFNLIIQNLKINIKNVLNEIQ